ncbi:fumarate hydratase [Clostridiaceae bacterium OttesenSCG-928-D20]|nr:fumarate hydratase [Clostridiaceae bacterium OttesenSCG-928-D20]
MRIISAKEIEKTVAELALKANKILPAATKAAIERAENEEPWPLAKGILGDIIENYRLAERLDLPVCQDTGAACVFIEIGNEVFIDGDLNESVNRGVKTAYENGYLRKSMVKDPLRRENTGDNTPAMLTIDFVPGDRLKITVAPKGFGSENMSAIKMLPPSAGLDGVFEFVLNTVKNAGPNACPPFVIGVGIGGSFDKCALLAKKALLRPVGSESPDEYYVNLEKRLLDAINETGIGPQGFGGKTTALSLAIEAMPTHIAALPCAVNINCHVARHLGRII